MNVLKALLILAAGLMMTLVVFPWLDALRDSIYHPVTPALHEYIMEGDDADVEVNSDNWAAQAFTVSVGYRLTGVQVKVWDSGGTGTLTVAVYAADGEGYPTGAALVSATVSSLLISNSTPGEFEVVSFGDDAIDVEVSDYDVVLHYAGSGVVYWRVISGATGYAYSTDGGSSWSH